MSGYSREKQMYPYVRAWLETLLREKYKRASITTYDTSRQKLWRFVEHMGLQDVFPDYQTYEINVDIVGLITKKKDIQFAFVECKLKPITLLDISQLLGYSLVAGPLISVIISPGGLSNAVSLLFNRRRYDILEYNRGKKIKVATWNKARNDIEPASLHPPGEFI